MGCSDRIIRFLDAWLQDRNPQLIVNNEATITKIKKDLPQGAVLSLICSLYVYTSDIHIDLPKEVKILQLADNVALYVELIANKIKV